MSECVVKVDEVGSDILNGRCYRNKKCTHHDVFHHGTAIYQEACYLICEWQLSSKTRGDGVDIIGLGLRIVLVLVIVIHCECEESNAAACVS